MAEAPSKAAKIAFITNSPNQLAVLANLTHEASAAIPLKVFEGYLWLHNTLVAPSNDDEGGQGRADADRTA